MAAKKMKKRYAVLVENTVKDLQDRVVLQRFIRYFSSDSLGLAVSTAASLKRIDHSYRILDGDTVYDEYIREGFNAVR